MASSYTGLGTELMTTGENAGTWGTTTNTNLQILEQISGGFTEQSIAGSAQTTTLSVSDGSTGAVLAHRVIEFTGTITGNQIVTIPLDVQQLYVVKNSTSGAYTVQFKYVSGSGDSVTWGTSDKGTKLIYATANHATNPDLVDSNIGGVGAVDLNGATLTLDADGDTDITADTDDQIDFKIGGTDQIKLTDGVLAPVTDNDVDLGTSSLEFKDAYFDGTVTTDGLTVSSTTNLDGAIQVDNTITVGVDDTGYDVKFFGDTASAYMLWDTSTDDLVLAGAAGIDLAGDIDVDGTANLDNTDIDGTLAVDGTTISLDATTSLNIDNSNTSNGITIGTATSGVPISIGHTTSEVTINDNLTVTGTLTLGSGAELAEAELELLDGITAGTAAASKAMVADANIDITGGRNITISGELDAATLDISGNADIDGTTNLDAVDIDGAVQIDAGVTVGVDDTGQDVKFFGATSGSFLLWDESDDALELTDSSPIKIGDGGDMQIYHDGSNSYVTNSQGALKIATETSGIAITLGHSTSEVTVADNLTVTGDLTVNGTTTTVNSTTVTIDDPIFTLGGDTAPGSDDNKDRGIEFRYHDGSSARIGFMGYDDSATGFTFLTAATNSSEVFSGTAAKIIAGELDISGNIDIDGTTNLDAVDIDGAVQLDATLTVGADDQGYDVKLFGDTASAYMLWDTSADDLILGGAAGLIVPDGQFTLGSTAVTATAAEINLIDGGTARGTTAVADGDGLLVNDGGTMRMTNVTTLKTYFQTGISSAADDLDAGDAAVNITTTSGNITIDAAANDTDIIFKGTDNNSDITMLTLDGSDAGSATFNHDIILGNDSFVRFGDAGEKITGDGTDLTINSSNDLHLTATTDINVPANVGLTFGDDAEKIEGDGTDLTITGNNIKLTATADVVLAANTGLVLDGSGNEKIESDGTDISISVGSNGDINVPANIGVTFGDDGEKIEGDGTDLTIASSAKINLTATSDIHIPNDVGIVFGGDSEKIEGDGTDLTISANNLTVDAAADITLDAAGNNLTFKSGGTSILDISNSSSDAVLTTSVQDKDLIIKGDDNGSAITAATFDMSDAGTLILNHDLVIGDAGYIGSASDTDAIAIASNGVVTFSQAPVFPDGSIAVADLDIDGATDINADLVDADLFIVDDGAGGTNRKVAASRIKTYIGGGTSWQAVKTGNYTASAGQGVFVNTTSAAITITLPAGTIGDEVTIVDYAGTFDSNACTVAANGSEKIFGSTDDLTVSTERAAFTLVFTDSTQGWLFKND